MVGIIHSVTKSVCLSEENFKLYRSIIERDENYKRICNYVENGCPNFHRLDELGQQFCRLKSELHFENGLLFLDHKLVIPTDLQGNISK